jgi:hypothetical protein
VTDRLPSDHDTVDSHRVTLERVGRTNRLRVPLPDDLAHQPGDILHLSFEGTVAHARVTERLDGRAVLDRAADNRRLARHGDGADRLHEWTQEAGLAVGDPIVVDVVTPDYAYGIRRPGERIIYAAPDPPSDSLTRLAEDLE